MVARTRWARRDYDLNELAPHLGLQPDVIVDARARYGARPVVETSAFMLAMPLEVFKVWKRTCALQSLEGGLLLRGLVQSMLLNARKPTWTGQGWIFQGHRMPMAGRHGKAWPYQVKTLLSRGADRALAEIGQHLGATKTGLVRGQVIDYLEGRTTQVILMGPEAMSNDPARYTKLWGIP